MAGDSAQLYRSACGAAFRDGRVSDGERILLDRLRRELGLSIQDAAAIEEQMGQAIEPSPQAGELDPEDFVRGLVRSARAKGPSPPPEERAQLVAIGKLVGVGEKRVLEWLDMPLDMLRMEGRELAARPAQLGLVDLTSYLGAVVTGYGGAVLLLVAFFLPAAQGYHDLGNLRVGAFFLAMPALVIPGTYPDGPIDVSRSSAVLRWLLAGSITVSAGSMVLALWKICWELRGEPLVGLALLAVTSPFLWRFFGRPIRGALVYAGDPVAAPALIQAMTPWETDEARDTGVW